MEPAAETNVRADVRQLYFAKNFPIRAVDMDPIILRLCPTRARPNVSLAIDTNAIRYRNSLVKQAPRPGQSRVADDIVGKDRFGRLLAVGQIEGFVIR